jgi:hypothetical protein
VILIDIVTSDGTWTHAECVRVRLVAQYVEPEADGNAPEGSLSVLWPEPNASRFKLHLHYDTMKGEYIVTLAEGLTEPQAHVKMKDIRTRILANKTIHVEKEQA